MRTTPRPPAERAGRGRTARPLLPPAYEPGVDHPSVGVLWDAVDLFRLFALCYACYEFAGRQHEVRNAALGWVVLAVLAVWTVAMLLHRRRTSAQLVVELCLSVAAILATVWVDDVAVRQAGASTVPGIWAGAIVIAAGVHRGVLPALGAWAAIVVADLVEIGTPTQGTMHNIFLLFIMAGCAGFTSQAARRSDEAVRHAVQLRAEAVERERLARTVHDGVLQALAFIHRRGDELGGPACELGDLAARQEVRLRDLISQGPRPRPHDPARDADLTAALRGAAREHGRHVQLAAPAEPVRAPADRVRELTAAVGAALDNVDAHAGPGARAWILIEDDEQEVLVTIRDDGVGMDETVVPAARAAGRIGVASSIEGRLSELGGAAACRSAPGAGTSWLLRMPRVGPPSR